MLALKTDVTILLVDVAVSFLFFAVLEETEDRHEDESVDTSNAERGCKNLIKDDIDPRAEGRYAATSHGSRGRIGTNGIGDEHRGRAVFVTAAAEDHLDHALVDSGQSSVGRGEFRARLQGMEPDEETDD